MPLSQPSCTVLLPPPSLATSARLSPYAPDHLKSEGNWNQGLPERRLSQAPGGPSLSQTTWQAGVAVQVSATGCRASSRVCLPVTQALGTVLGGKDSVGYRGRRANSQIRESWNHHVLTARHQASPSEFLCPIGMRILSRRVRCRNSKQSTGVLLRTIPFPTQGAIIGSSHRCFFCQS